MNGLAFFLATTQTTDRKPRYVVFPFDHLFNAFNPELLIEPTLDDCE
jgi:hypothetical protein